MRPALIPVASFALAASLLLPVSNANAADDDDKLLGSTSMKESTLAYYTVSVIAFPSVCQVTLPAKVKAASERMAAKHGDALLRAVRAKMVEPDIAAVRSQWCSKIAKFIEGIGP
ncbi:hypothetical protein [Bradyrhizobium neotropicale]|uniref:hypothetical protein n=1 Tax=Bradyrhizobium neotropicale TaxID=1497615 RepID=UPI001AD6EB39|nr:hypothetical protein [Bradyrhizobium neotropicale]MBO4228370.1 hypothetical protein [Bradyrhizobium neotropicale]